MGSIPRPLPKCLTIQISAVETRFLKQDKVPRFRSCYEGKNKPRQYTNAASPVQFKRIRSVGVFLAMFVIVVMIVSRDFSGVRFAVDLKNQTSRGIFLVQQISQGLLFQYKP